MQRDHPEPKFGIDLDACMSLNEPKVQELQQNELIEFNDYLVLVFETRIEYHESFFDESSNFRQLCNKVLRERALQDLLLYYFPTDDPKTQNELRLLFRSKQLPVHKKE
jgi:hypothetical protein